MYVAENCPSFQVFVYHHTSCEQKAKTGEAAETCRLARALNGHIGYK